MAIRSLIILVAIVSAAIAVPAAAQDSVPPAGRFQLAPGKDSSFVRLDTRTGSVSHCRQVDGVWQCEPIIDSDLASRLTALSANVDRLSADVDRLSLKVDRLAKDVGAPSPAPETGTRAAGKPTGFAQTAVHRLLDMIRVLKHGRADAT